MKTITLGTLHPEESPFKLPKADYVALATKALSVYSGRFAVLDSDPLDIVFPSYNHGIYWLNERDFQGYFFDYMKQEIQSEFLLMLTKNILHKFENIDDDRAAGYISEHNWVMVRYYPENADHTSEIITHEFGHALGLIECNNQKCPMKKDAQTDENIGFVFCDEHQKLLSKIL